MFCLKLESLNINHLPNRFAPCRLSHSEPSKCLYFKVPNVSADTFPVWQNLSWKKPESFQEMLLMHSMEKKLDVQRLGYSLKNGQDQQELQWRAYCCCKKEV